METKKCRNPNHEGSSELPASTEFFHAHKDNKDGLQTWCKVCRKRYDHERHVAKIDARAQVGA